MEGLISARRDPGPTLETRRIAAIADFPIVDSCGDASALFEVDLPRRLAVPFTKAFADKSEILFVVRMENERQRRQTLGGKSAWELAHGETTIAHFVHDDHVWPRMLERGDVIERAMVGLSGDARRVKFIVYHIFGGGEALESDDEFSCAARSSLQNLWERTGDRGIDRWHRVVYSARQMEHGTWGHVGEQVPCNGGSERK